MISVDKAHGDEHILELTPEQQVAVEIRARELMAERLADRDKFDDLVSGIDSSEIMPHVHRALMNLDGAIRDYVKAGVHSHNIDAVFSAITIIQSIVGHEAKTAWREDCEREAEDDLFPLDIQQ